MGMVEKAVVRDAGVYGANTCVIYNDSKYSCHSLDADPDCDRTGMPGADYFGGVCKYMFKSTCEELFARRDDQPGP